MPVCARMMLSTFAFCLSLGLSPQAHAQEQREDVVLSVDRDIVRWAAVYKMSPDRPDDPYFHVRVFERRKGWQPWRFTELAFHMAVTPKALEASRTGKKARTFNYKDVEFRVAYRRWLEDPSARAKVPVCDTDIPQCLKTLPR